MGAAGAIAGGVLGGVGGLLGGKKEGGSYMDNAYAGLGGQGTTDSLGKNIFGNYLMPQQKDALDLQSANTSAANQLQTNPALSTFFGKGGYTQQLADEQKQLANQGFELTPEDRTAYGQASGDIARMFGESDQSMAQALANRGLSNSGAAGAAFSGSQGNKMEQLAKAQQQIAQARYQSNLQRLGQTRQALGQMGQQTQSALGQQFGLQQNEFENQRAKAQDAMQYLRDVQGANQAGAQFHEGTKSGSATGQFLGGALGGALGGGRLGGALSGGGGSSGGMAGGSYSSGGVLA